MNRPACRHGGKRGFSLVEVLVATAIFAVLVNALIAYFMSTRRQAAHVEQKLREAMIAQTAVERLRDLVETNPYFLGLHRDGEGKVEFWGAVGPGRDGIPPNPLFAHLINLDGATLYGDGNASPLLNTSHRPRELASSLTPGKLGEAERQNLGFTLGSHACRVTIRDAAPLAFGPDSAADENLSELLKEVRVAVYRFGPRPAGSPWEPTFTLSWHVPCPLESLSDDAFRRFETSQAAFDYGAIRQEAVQVFDEDPNFRRLDETTKDMFGDIFVILQEINGQAFLTEGVDDNLLVRGTVAEDLKCINDWISDLQPKTHLIFRKELARLHETKARLVFQAFRRSWAAAESLEKKHQDLVATIRDIRTRLADIKQKILVITDKTLNALAKRRDATKDVALATADLATAASLAAAGDELLTRASALMDESVDKRNAAAMLPETIPDPTWVPGGEEGEEGDEEEEAGDGGAIAAVAPEIPNPERVALLEEADRLKDDSEEKEGRGKEKKDDAKKNKAKADRDLSKARKDLDEAEAVITASTSGFENLKASSFSEVVEFVEVVLRCFLLNQFFAEAKYVDTINRIRAYPASFSTALNDAIALYRSMDASGDATPLDRVTFGKRLAELLRVRMLVDLGSGTSPEAPTADFTPRAAEYDGGFRPFAEFFVNNEVHDRAKLKRRHDAFLAQARRFETLRGGDDVYSKVLDHYRPGGEIRNFVSIYTEIQDILSMASAVISSRIQAEFDDLVGQAGAVDDQTTQAILDRIAQYQRDNGDGTSLFDDLLKGGGS